MQGVDLTCKYITRRAAMYFVRQILKYYLKCALNPLNWKKMPSKERKTPDRWGERPGVGVLPRGAGGNSLSARG
jgi:hypothetical protein